MIGIHALDAGGTMLVSAGESIMDLIAESGSNANGESYRARPGGSPYNCAVAMAKLGGDVGFLCPFSQDLFGEKLVQHLVSMGVTPLVPDRVHAPTALAVVSIADDGQPSYAFYRNDTADRQLREPLVTESMPEVISAFHFGSLCLANAADSKVWLELALNLRQKDVLITLDPNLRPALIDSMTACRERLGTAYELCDVLKFSDEDLGILYPDEPAYERLVMIQEQHQIPLVILTKGVHGSTARTLNGVMTEAPPFPIRTMGDTVGAGDTFQAAVVFWLTEHFEQPRRQAHTLEKDALTALLRFANTAAGLTCQERGCNPPTREHVDAALLTQWWLMHED